MDIYIINIIFHVIFCALVFKACATVMLNYLSYIEGKYFLTSSILDYASAFGLCLIFPQSLGQVLFSFDWIYIGI